MITAKTLFLHIMMISGHYDSNIQNINVEQALCLATNVYHESRGEPEQGQYAVAHTTMNRVKDRRYPSNICDVVKSHRGTIPGSRLPAINRCQFSWYCDGKSDVIRLSNSKQIIDPNYDAFVSSSIVAITVLLNRSKDVTGGATHYFNDTIADPIWAQYYTHTTRIGQHVFYRREPRSLK